MPRKELAVDNVAEAYLALLAERGVEYLFANAGTDFAPLVEAFAKAARTGNPVPPHCLAPDRDAERGLHRQPPASLVIARESPDIDRHGHPYGSACRVGSDTREVE